MLHARVSPAQLDLGLKTKRNVPLVGGRLQAASNIGYLNVHHGRIAAQHPNQ
jgi:hypothetical protein